jgi:drug/metabolite transporter (DMT)-like permease
MVLGAAILWGSSATAAQFLQNQNVSTLLISQTRVSLSCILLLAALATRRKDLLKVIPADLWRFLLLGVIGIAGANFTYYFTMKLSTVATGILLQYLAPLAVVTYMVLSKEETLSLRKVGAAFLSLAGCFLAVGGAGPSALRIGAMALGTGILSMGCYAFLTLFSRHLLRRYPSWTVIFYSLAFASVFWMAVHPVSEIMQEPHSLPIWLALGALSISSVLLPYLLYFSGLRRISASRVILLSTSEPVVAIASAAIVLGEVLDAWKVLGAVLVLGAILVLQSGQEKDAVEPQQASRESYGS